MSRKIVVSPWNPGDNEDGVPVPALLRTALRASRLLVAAPARLWHARDGWRLGVSSALARLQRLIAVVTCILVLTFYLLESTYWQVNYSGFEVLIILTSGELALITTVYAFGVWTESGRLEQIISLLRQMQNIRISTSLNHESLSKRSKVGGKLLIFYLIWLTLSCVDAVLRIYNIMRLRTGEITLILKGLFYYYFMVIQMLQLQWSITIMELKSTLTVVNDQLERLLISI